MCRYTQTSESLQTFRPSMADAPAIDAARIKQVLQSSDPVEVRSMALSLGSMTQPNSPQESQLLQLQIMLWNRLARLDASAEQECCQTVGALWTRMNEPEKAVSQLQKALAMDANNPKTHSLLGDAMFQASNYPASIQSHERAIELLQQTNGADQDLATAYSKLGTVLESKGDFDQAIAILTKAKALVSETDETATIKAELHAKLGAMHDHLGQYALAVQELEQAIAIYTQMNGVDDPQVQELTFIMEMAASNAKE